MNARAPLTPLRCDVEPGFGAFDGAALIAAQNRAAAGEVFRSLSAQIFLLVAVVAMSGMALALFWAEIARYESALKHCAGV